MNETEVFSFKTETGFDLGFTRYTVRRAKIVERFFPNSSATNPEEKIRRLLHGLIFRIGNTQWDFSKIQENESDFLRINLALSEVDLRTFARMFLELNPRYLGEETIRLKFGNTPESDIPIKDHKNEAKFEEIRKIQDPVQKLAKALELQLEILRTTIQDSLGVVGKIPNSISSAALEEYHAEAESLRENMRTRPYG